MEYRIKRAQISDKVVIRNLLQLYLHELTEFEDRPLSKSGEYHYHYLDNYWAERGRYPYLFFNGKELMGFALVRRVENRYSMAEFFILRKFRRHRFGLRCAVEIIKKHQGEWKLEFLSRNEVAEKFWQKVALNLAGGDVEAGKVNDISNYLRFPVGRS